MKQRLEDIYGEAVTADLKESAYPYLLLGDVKLSGESTHRLAHMLADLVLVSRKGGCGFCGRQ